MASSPSRRARRGLCDTPDLRLEVAHIQRHGNSSGLLAFYRRAPIAQRHRVHATRTAPKRSLTTGAHPPYLPRFRNVTDKHRLHPRYHFQAAAAPPTIPSVRRGVGFARRSRRLSQYYPATFRIALWRSASAQETACNRHRVRRCGIPGSDSTIFSRQRINMPQEWPTAEEISAPPARGREGRSRKNTPGWSIHEIVTARLGDTEDVGSPTSTAGHAGHVTWPTRRHSFPVAPEHTWSILASAATRPPQEASEGELELVAIRSPQHLRRRAFPNVAVWPM